MRKIQNIFILFSYFNCENSEIALILMVFYPIFCHGYNFRKSNFILRFNNNCFLTVVVMSYFLEVKCIYIEME